jgi:nicotinamide mononucleotide transporter
MRFLKNAIVQSVAVAIVLTGLSYLVGVWAGWIHGVDYLEAFAVFTSYACTFLCVKQKRINYPIGAVSTAAYTILFLQAGLYSSMLLNLWLTPWLIYGWIRWRADSNARPVTWVRPFKWWFVYLGVAGIGYILAAWASGALGGTLAFADAFILAGTIMAQTLMDNKKIENWIVWFAIDVVAIGTYFGAGLPLASFQYLFFTFNAVWGFIEWRKTMVKRKPITLYDGAAWGSNPNDPVPVDPVLAKAYADAHRVVGK